MNRYKLDVLINFDNMILSTTLLLIIRSVVNWKILEADSNIPIVVAPINIHIVVAPINIHIVVAPICTCFVFILLSKLFGSRSSRMKCMSRLRVVY